MITPSSHRDRIGHGFTLVEMLATLGILSLLVLVAVSWMTTLIARSEADQARAGWDRAAGMVLEQIGRELLQIELIDEARRRNEPRVWVDQDALHIRTIDAGQPVTVRYALQANGPELAREVMGRPADRGRAAPLLAGVEVLGVELSPPDQQRALARLRIEIRSVDGHARARTFTLREEDLMR